MSALRHQVEAEAAAANAALSALRDAAVSDALAIAARLVGERRHEILAANAADYEAATGRFDEGTLDRLRLDDDRLDDLVRQVAVMAELAPLEREADSWTLPNGLLVSERRIPIGTVGANFEARPNVALDVAGQLLKSLNTAVLRTGGAALRTVTVLVDEVLRPALEAAGLPPGAVGLVRSPEREGARVLVSLPQRIPLVILRGSGETTAALARLAAENGVRTLAHAEGGGVLYVHGTASPEMALTLVDASLDRLGVCNRLNLLLVDRAAVSQLPALARGAHRARTRDPRRRRGRAPPRPEARLRVGERRRAGLDRDGRARRTVSRRRCGSRTRRRLASPRASSRRTRWRPRRSSTGIAALLRTGTRRTRYTDGFELTGAPETGINVDWAPGPRGPVTYRDLWLRQYRVIGDGTQHR